MAERETFVPVDILVPARWHVSSPSNSAHDSDTAATISATAKGSQSSDVASSDEISATTTVMTSLVGGASQQDESAISLSASTSEWISGLLDSLDSLFQLTASGYTKKEDSHEFLEKVIMELVNIRQTFVKLDITDRTECANDIGDRPQFMTSLVQFMIQVYKGESVKLYNYALQCI